MQHTKIRHHVCTKEVHALMSCIIETSRDGQNLLTMLVKPVTSNGGFVVDAVCPGRIRSGLPAVDSHIVLPHPVYKKHALFRANDSC